MCDKPDVTKRRFVTIEDVMKVLLISKHQAYTLVRSGKIAAIQVGGRGQWRIEDASLEDYIVSARNKVTDNTDAT